MEPIEVPTLDVRKPGRVNHSLHHLSVYLGTTFERSSQYVIRYDLGYRKRYGVPARPGNPKLGQFDLSEPSPRCRVCIFSLLSPKLECQEYLGKSWNLLARYVAGLRDREKCVELKGEESIEFSLARDSVPNRTLLLRLIYIFI